MKLGFIGLGRMGSNMVARMLRNNLEVVVWNRSKEKVKLAVENGAIEALDTKDMVGKLDKPRIVWIMLPSGDVTEDKFNEVVDELDKGDIIIEGANSNFHDTIRRHKIAKEKGIKMLDVGVSGGIVAAERGYPMMIGGSKNTYDYCEPIFRSFGKENGYGLVGEAGSGHYVKMIHNAIEYGMMQSIAEGFDLLSSSDTVGNLDLSKISTIWNNGTIIESFLMEMTKRALAKDSKLDYLKAYVDDSGEGEWASIEALEKKVPFVVNSYALHARRISRDNNSYAFRLLSAMRNEFGGHAIKK